MIQTGVRVSELTGLRLADVHISRGPHIRALGKGRKKRSATLTGDTVKVLSAWISERQGQPDESTVDRLGLSVRIDPDRHDVDLSLHSNDERTPCGHFLSGRCQAPSSHARTALTDGRHTLSQGQPIGDQTRESQPEAVKGKPLRALSTQRLISLSLNQAPAEISIQALRESVSGNPTSP